MKNILSFILTLAVLAGFTLDAAAQSYPLHSPRSFLAGTNLTANTANTLAYGSTNIWYQPVVLYGTNTVVAKTNALGIVDVPLWINPDGTAPNVYLNMQIQGAAADTNTWTLVFAGCPFAGVPATDAMNKFTTSIVANGATAVALSTNLPARVVQGMASVRLLSATPSAGSVTNTIWRNLALTGGTP